MLDTHTHILPNVDDGSRSVRQSIEMLLEEKKQGIRDVVLTPHFYADRESPECFAERREKAFRALEAEAAGKAALPRRHLGAEVAYFGGISRAEELDLFCVDDTQIMLVEMPFDRWGKRVLNEIESLNNLRGIQPVIAHIERYMRFQPKGTIMHLCEMGCWIQANASFFLDWKTQWLAMHMLKNREIHFLGSDCHNMSSRAPNLGVALQKIEKRLGRTALKHLAEMEDRLLEGK